MRGTVFKKSGKVLTRVIAGETLLVPVMGSVADMQRLFSLNSVGAFVWEQIDGARRVDEIAGAVADEFEVTVEQGESDTKHFVSELLQAGLIEEVK